MSKVKRNSKVHHSVSIRSTHQDYSSANDPISIPLDTPIGIDSQELPN